MEGELSEEQIKNYPLVDDRFTVLDIIGEGRYSKVKLVYDIISKTYYAMKIWRKKLLTQQNIDLFINEVNVLSSLMHHHVVKIIYVNLNGICLHPDGSVCYKTFYCMELIKNGELDNLLQCIDKFDEKIARYIFSHLISAVDYLHGQGLAHRDIKPENILIDDLWYLKLCDFGFCTKLLNESNEKIIFDPSVPVGSIEFNAPEITNGTNESGYFPDETDIFSLGVVLFMVVMKNSPFHSTSSRDPYYTKFCNLDKSSFWKIFNSVASPSLEFKDLIEKMMDYNPESRIKLDEIKTHPWVTGELPSDEEIRLDLMSKISVMNEIKKTTILPQRRETKIKISRPKNAIDKLSVHPILHSAILQYGPMLENLNAQLMENEKLRLQLLKRGTLKNNIEAEEKKLDSEISLNNSAKKPTVSINAIESAQKPNTVIEEKRIDIKTKSFFSSQKEQVLNVLSF